MHNNDIAKWVARVSAPYGARLVETVRESARSLNLSLSYIDEASKGEACLVWFEVVGQRQQIEQLQAQMFAIADEVIDA